MSSVQIARYIISFSWLYHGILPKLIHIAPLEKLMTTNLPIIGLSLVLLNSLKAQPENNRR